MFLGNQNLQILHSEGAEFAGANLMETLLTQWRSSVGVLNPSPLKTWPKCPPQAVHVISVLLPSGSGCKIVLSIINSAEKCFIAMKTTVTEE
jgi:hypothetical protein